jgi:hypothetical protein
MPIKLKPVLALAAGIVVFLAPASIQTSGLFRPVLGGKTQVAEAESKAIPFHPDADSAQGLYGYRYRGF